ncbi:MAG: class I SAM-dependent methyltransferase [Nanoarchaeota archaeon]|nr:class I SAM-dependent methyltransferase [Nanoarchaeota archaeon]
MSDKEKWENQAKEWKNLFYDEKSIPLKWLLNVANKKDKILDQGCGVGQYALSIYKFGFRKITGLDFSEKLLKIARNHAKKLNYKIDFINGDIRQMPFKNKSFEGAISAGVVEHVPETEKAIKELSRVIKGKGYLIIHVPHKISLFTLVKLIQQLTGLWKIGFEKSFTKKEFSRILNTFNFEIENYYLSPFVAGKHKILGGFLSFLDKPLYIFGFGGHHMCFLCKKIK